MTRPPPYSYDLAILINPQWDKMDWNFPWTCAGRFTGTTRIQCDKDVVWWHPYTSQTSSYCDECCTPYDKNVFIGRWRETKATLVARDMFNRQPLKLISDKLGFKESHKKDICHLVGLLTWDFHHLKEVGIKQPLLDFIQWITTQEPEE